MNWFTFKFGFLFLICFALFCIACKKDNTSPIDQYYCYLDKNQPSNISEGQLQHRLDRELELYSLNRYETPTFKNSNFIEKYSSLLDSLLESHSNLEVIINTTKPKNWIDSIYLYELAYCKYNNQENIISFPISKNKFLNFSNLSLSKQYNTLRNLVNNCDKFEFISRPLEENITLNLLLHLFEKNDLTNVFPALYIDILQMKATGFLTENEVDNIRYGDLAIVFFEKELEHIKKHKLFDQLGIATTNLSEAYLKIGDTVSFFNLLENRSFTEDSNYVFQSLGLTYLEIDSTNLALEYLSKIEKSVGPGDFYLNMDLMNAYAQKKDFELVEKYLNNCRSILDTIKIREDSILYEFNLSESMSIVEQEKFEHTKDIIHLENAFKNLKDRRDIGSDIFYKDLSYHANEFYAFNTENLIKVAYKIQENNCKNSPKSIAYLIDCILESKKKDEFIDPSSYSRRTNDYTKYNDFRNQLHLNNYLEFFTNYSILDHSLDSNLIIEAKNRIIPNTEINQYHFLKGRLNYWCLSVCNNSSKIFTIPISTLEKQIETQVNSLSSDKTYSIQELGIWKELKLHNKDTLLIYGDGILNEYPFESNLEQVIRCDYYLSDSIVLSPTKSSILSYSNNYTNREIKEREFKELIGGYNECLSLSKLLGNVPIVEGYDCTIPNFQSALSSDILHIATHANSKKNNRLESYLVLRDNLGGAVRLYADEILAMPAVPKFVNLSACQTGTGVHMAGAGTYSIARSFLQKGSEAVMKTLWDVDDEATKEFMILFYSKWVEGMSCGEALRQTKQEFKASKKYAAPFYWAGFILEGNPNLYISKN